MGLVQTFDLNSILRSSLFQICFQSALFWLCLIHYKNSTSTRLRKRGTNTVFWSRTQCLYFDLPIKSPTPRRPWGTTDDVLSHHLNGATERQPFASKRELLSFMSYNCSVYTTEDFKFRQYFGSHQRLTLHTAHHQHHGGEVPPVVSVYLSLGSTLWFSG